MLTRLSEFIARRRGLLPMIAVVLIALNFLLQFVPGLEAFNRYNVFLHLGLIVGLIGILLSQALG